MHLLDTPGSFFQPLVAKAIHKRRLAIDAHTEVYLVDLLVRFIDPRALFLQNEDGSRAEEKLALLLEKALLAKEASARESHLRRLGDVSLYTAGFFSDRLSSKVVDVGYYIGMGRSAYQRLGDVVGPCRQVFQELASEFQHFVDILYEISDQTRLNSPTDVLRTYEKWIQTQSRKAEEKLRSLGIMPNRSIKRDWQ